MINIEEITKKAKISSQHIAKSSTAQRNQAIVEIGNALEENHQQIINANCKDLANFDEKYNSPSHSLIDRLTINEKVFNQMIESCNQVVELPDPIGEISELNTRPTGIKVGKMRVPLGVVGIIFESRPNVTQEASVLCLKSANACVLRGGSEAINTNIAIAQAVKIGIERANLPAEAVQLISSTNRTLVKSMLKSANIDVLIPRGGKSLIKLVTDNARMPVIKHLDGNCHVYIEKSADINMALAITDNAKNQRYSTCNAAESIVVDEKIASKFLPKLVQMFSEKAVEIRACSKSLQIIKQAGIDKNISKASEEDYYCEYLAPIISIKIVENISEAILHINKYSSKHTDAIVTSNHQHAMKFLSEVDSSSVMINASTRFADGFEYGLGAEIGISTDKFHARGPVGLEGLTSQKWVIFGNGELRN